MGTKSLKKAISIAGSQTALAGMIGKKQSHIWTWLNRDKKVPPLVARQIESALNGQVTAEELRL